MPGFDQDTIARLEALRAKGVDVSALLAGMHLAEQKRAPRITRQDPIKRAADYLPAELKQTNKLAPRTAPKAIKEPIRIWGLVGCKSWLNNRGGAWRVWTIAHYLDKQGSGRVSRIDLWGKLERLGVGERKRRRWVNQALRSELMRYNQGDDHYYLVSHGKAAVILGAELVGRPARVELSRLVDTGWRSVVWAATLATMEGSPRSRENLAAITGIPERTQRHLENQLEVIYRRNYAKTDLSGDQLTGFTENNREAAFVGLDNRIYYRLPDIRVIDLSEAQAAPKGRSKKAQKVVNISSTKVREQVQLFRLFHGDYKAAEGAIRRAGRKNIPAWELPREVFYLDQAGRKNNVWKPVSGVDYAC